MGWGILSPLADQKVRKQLYKVTDTLLSNTSVLCNKLSGYQQSGMGKRREINNFK